MWYWRVSSRALNFKTFDGASQVNGGSTRHPRRAEAKSLIKRSCQSSSSLLSHSILPHTFPTEFLMRRTCTSCRHIYLPCEHAGDLSPTPARGRLARPLLSPLPARRQLSNGYRPRICGDF